MALMIASAASAIGDASFEKSGKSYAIRIACDVLQYKIFGSI